MKSITTKDLGIDEPTGLNKILEVYRIDINADTETINIEYRINLLAPKNSEVVKSNSFGYNRYNRPEQKNEKGETLREAKMKFDQLRDSEVGKAIIGLIQLDLNEFPNLEQE